MARIVRTFWWWIPFAFAIGVAGGYAFGRVFRETAEPGEMISTSAPHSPGTPDFTAAETSGTPALPDDLAPDSRLGILERIAATSLDDLPALSRELLGGDGDYLMTLALLDRWIELDPRAGFAFFTGGESGKSGPPWESAAFEFCGRWALVDPDGALEAARSLEEGTLAQVAFDRISGALAAERPADYFRLLATLKDHKGFHYGISRAARVLALSDPQAALAAFDALDSETRSRYGVAADLASGWAQDDPEGALAFARSLDDEKDRTRALRAVASRLMESNPERAASIYKEGGSLGDNNEGTSISYGDEGEHVNYDWPRLALALGDTDPAAAMAWVARHFPEDAGRHLFRFLPKDAVTAFDALAALPDTVLKDGKLPGWPVPNWRPFEIEAALARLPQITDPVKRESVQTWLLGAQATSDPRNAIGAALHDLSDPENRAHVLQQGMATWAREDLTTASQWLATRPPGVETDGAITSLVNVAQYFEPESALAWAGTISDPEARLRQVSMVWWSWKETDETAARSALAAMPLDEATKAELRNRGSDF